MSCIGLKCKVKGNVTFEHCLSCDGVCKTFPLFLRKKLLKNYNGNGNIRVTKLIYCLRKSYLEMTQPYHISLNGIISMGIGTLIHSALEEGFDIAERFVSYTTPKGTKITGHIDGINLNTKTIFDLKTTAYGQYKQNKEMVEDHNTLQLQVYWTIGKKIGFDFKHGKLIYIGLGDKICVERIVPFKDQTEFINKRADILQDVLDKGIAPVPSPLWDWECKDDFCAFKDDCPKFSGGRSGLE